jgi:hypothetical protein
MHYHVLAQGEKHFKEIEGGHNEMSEIVEEYARKYAREYAEKEKIVSIQNLMKNMKLTLEQALNALEIQGDERGYNKTVTEIMSNYSIRESRHSAKIKVECLLYLNSTISFGIQPIMSHNFSTVRRVIFLPFFKLSRVLLSTPDFKR